MGKNINYSCDGCHKVVYGIDKNKRVEIPHIQINGQIVEQDFDKETGYRNHTFITPTNAEKLCFCLDTWQDCMSQYIQTRKFLWNQRREEILKGQASEDTMIRLRTSK